MNFQERILELAKAKQDLQDKEEKHRAAIFEVETAKNKVKKLDEELRQAACEYFRETGDKTPHEAINIRTVLKYTYDEEATLQRAIELGASSALKLNLPAVKILEKEDGITWAVKEESLEIVPYIRQSLGDYIIMEEFDARSGSD